MLQRGQAAFPDLPFALDLLSDDFLSLLEGLQGELGPRVRAVREARGARLRAALKDRKRPVPLPPSEASRSAWRVPALPALLEQPGVEISGPAAVTPMMIHALNPGPDGQRAVGYLDDDEDSAGHCLADTLRAARNRRDALLGTLAHDEPERGRRYRLAPGALPFFVHRERGLHLDEPELTIGGQPVAATLLGTALTLYHAGRVHAERGDSIHFYLPKTESVAEAALYRELFDALVARLPHLCGVPIRAILLVESLPAAFEMEEMLFALGPYAAGLNAARWDLKASLIEYAMTDASSLWPDRFDVDVKTTPCLANLFRRLVAVCAKHGAVAVGGMATALPSADEEVNRQAAAAIRADKEWEAELGFRRGWAAHIHHMSTAAGPFVELAKRGWQAGPELSNPERWPVAIETPRGAISEEGTRRNLRVLLEYLEGWLRGRGAKGIDSLAGRPGKRPALMEDLATARISVAQTAQRLLHGARAEDTGRRHDIALVKRLLDGELRDILARLEPAAAAEASERYQLSRGIALHWLRCYLELDFRSLGSRPRAELTRIGAGPDAL